MGQLFRRESLGAREPELLGVVRATVPASLKVLLACGGVFFLAVAIFVALANYARKVEVEGYLAPEGGDIKLAALVNGTVRSIRFKTGDRVRKGDVVAVVSTEIVGEKSKSVSELSAKEAGRVLDAITTIGAETEMLDRQPPRLYDEAAKQARAVIDNLKKQIELRRAQLLEVTALVSDLKPLMDEGAISRVAFINNKAKIDEINSQIFELERQISLQRSQLSDIEIRRVGAINDAMWRSLNLKNLESEKRNAKASSEAESAHAVLAPEDGTISLVNVSSGAGVAAGQPIVNLSPSRGQIEAVLYIPDEAYAFVRTGQEIYLQVQAFPYQNYGQVKAKIYEVSTGTVAKDNESRESSEKHRRFYLARASLEYESMAWSARGKSLASGMTFISHVNINERHIYEWLLFPLNQMKSASGMQSSEGGGK